MTNPYAGPQYQTHPDDPSRLVRVRQDHEPVSEGGIPLEYDNGNGNGKDGEVNDGE